MTEQEQQQPKQWRYFFIGFYAMAFSVEKMMFTPNHGCYTCALQEPPTVAEAKALVSKKNGFTGRVAEDLAIVSLSELTRDHYERIQRHDVDSIVESVTIYDLANGQTEIITTLRENVEEEEEAETTESK